MIHGIGLDMVHIPRFEAWKGRRGLLERYFHPGELAESARRGEKWAPSLAARFAAKEALGKALGDGLRGLILKEIEVVKDPRGRPELKLHGQCQALVEALGIRRIHLSLTHEHETAAAMVVLEV